MRVLLTIQNGSHAGSQLELYSGKVGLVGRASWAELSIPDDQRMSGRHFTLECGGGECKLRDQKSSNGTFVNGKRVSEASLHNGDQVLAGATLMAVQIDATIAPPAPPPPGAPPAYEETMRASKRGADRARPTTPASPPHAGEHAAPEKGALERVVLTIAGGPYAGRRLVVQPGKTALVGRASWADLALPDDRRLSGRHFSVDCTAEGCVLHDQKSTNGTLVNGLPVKEARLKPGDVVTAGGTSLSVSFYRTGDRPLPTESDLDLGAQLPQGGVVLPADSAMFAPPPAPPASPAPPPVPADGTVQDHLLHFLRSTQEPLYALLDAARDPKVLDGLRASKALFESLYEGARGEELAPWAPYLVFLPPQSRYLDQLVRESWGKSWGVFVISRGAFAEVRKHFRKFLLVKLPDGKEVYFRFYDPRVLRVFLATCNAEQMTAFFGPISAFYTETGDPDTVLQFTAGERGVRKTLLAVWTDKPEALQFARSGMWLKEEVELPG
jgi:pSer/pThr/pTyr-binding forkhead associated (FHA) protein